MSFKTILVHYTDHLASQNALDSAVALAQLEEAHVTVAVVAYDMSLPLAAALDGGSSDAGVVLSTAMEKYRQAAVDKAEDLHQKAEKYLQKSGLSYDVRQVVVSMDAAPHALSMRARHADITLLGHAAPKSDVFEPVIDGLLFQSGRPLILIPEGKTLLVPPGRVLVAWDNGREAARAIHESLPLLKKAKMVTILTIGGGGKQGYGDPPGADIAALLVRHGVAVETRHEKDNLEFPEQIILRVGQEGGYSLGVMGAYGRSRIRQWILGGVTRSVLQGLTFPVLMAH